MAEDRFWQRVRKTETCWLWTGYRNDNGYGQVGFNGHVRLAHRVAYTLAFGIIPEGMDVLHHCDNPSCVRPDHLFLGTQLDNIRDRDTKGRGVVPAILTDVQAQKIKVALEDDHYGLKASLARQYGVSLSTVSAIAHGRLRKTP